MRRTGLASLLVLLSWTPLPAAHLGMGLRVGEVTQTSAIVWTRLTATAERNHEGFREPKKRQPRKKKYVPSTVPVAKRHGEISGAAGQVRLSWHKRGGVRTRMTPWIDVTGRTDFVHQFRIEKLQPGTEYLLRVEARDGKETEITARAEGSFHTPGPPDRWQDVTFSVVTGQSYWDLDDPAGYHIYPAMGRLKPDFIVPTGDTVYLDSEAPRARTIPLARFHWHRMYSLPRHVAFHRHVPGYWEVDDHDSWCNDDWPALKAPWMSPLTFKQGFAVYREQVPMGKLTYRTVRWGRGLQIWMVEGRLFRSANTMPDGPDKTIWGAQQMAWLKRTVAASDADFRVLISPTPIVGPDRPKGKNDNHSNSAFAHEGNAVRDWTRSLKNFFVCCGDRHWQYLSIDPKTRLREFSCGPASDEHAGGSPGRDPALQPFHRQRGGFLSVSVTRTGTTPMIAFRFHDVHGRVVYEYTAQGTPAAG